MRRYGLEIEFAADQSQIAQTVQHCHESPAKVRLATGGYRKYCWPSGWKVSFDPSLRQDGHAPDRCVELNTPARLLAELPDWIDPTLFRIAQIPHEFTPRCGLHIHADAYDLTPGQILRVCRRASASQEFQRCHPHRAKFLRPLPEGLLMLNEDVATDADLRAAWYAGYSSMPKPGTARLHPSRRRLLNLHSYWYRRTLEFRWFPTTLDTSTIHAHLSRVDALIEEAL